MIVLYPGWFILIFFLYAIFGVIFLYSDTVKEKLYCESRKGFLIVPICGVIAIFCLILSMSKLNEYFIYDKSSPIEITEVLDDENIKITTVEIIKTKKRNLFTGKWGDESTASFEEKIINIRYEQNER